MGFIRNALPLGGLSLASRMFDKNKDRDKSNSLVGGQMSDVDNRQPSFLGRKY